MKSARTLLRLALRSRATDVVLAPGTLVGNLHLRAGFRSLHSQPLPIEALEVLSTQLGRMAGLSSEAPPLAVQVGSLDLEEARVRVTRMVTASGPLVRLRFQSLGLLEEARAEFRKGLYGGTEVRNFLKLPWGLVLVTGPPSSGKTSALAHLLEDLDRPLLLSEARELGPGVERVESEGALRERLEDRRAVALDEMDERDKLRLVRELAAAHRVLATLTAPHLAAALRMVRSQGVEPEPILGALRVTWQDLGQERRLAYTWFSVGEGRRGCCPVCGERREGAAACAGCGLPPVARYLDREVLRRMNTPEGYRALDRLEEEWEVLRPRETSGP